MQFDVRKQAWIPWMDTVPEFLLDPKTPFSEIAVPTIDTIRSAYLLEILVKHNFNVLCCGATGTGKSVVVNEKLGKGMPDMFVPKNMAFSASTSANQTQVGAPCHVSYRTFASSLPPAHRSSTKHLPPARSWHRV
jgi:dynein heavy chain